METEFETFSGFQWDEGNSHRNLLKHHVEDWECEQAFFNEPLLVLDDPEHSLVEKCWAAFGRTDRERLLVVIFTRKDKLLRVVSAREMKRKEKTSYEEKPNRIPQFKNEDEEREFWATHSPFDYFDSQRFKRASFPNLKPSLKSISIRLPADMLAELRALANKKDVPYQSLAKICPARQIALECVQWPD